MTDRAMDESTSAKCALTLHRRRFPIISLNLHDSRLLMWEADFAFFVEAQVGQILD